MRSFLCSLLGAFVGWSVGSGAADYLVSGFSAHGRVAFSITLGLEVAFSLLGSAVASEIWRGSQ